ncbi:MAG: molybdopterin-dependent oxidoreductase [Rhodospirillales bacterium]
MRIGAVILFFFLILAAIPAAADIPLPLPKGPVILTVSGDLSVANVGGEAHFDAAMLEELGLVNVKTSTSWTTGAPVFRGVLVRDLLARLGAKGVSVEAIALNDYRVRLPIGDFAQYDVILAMWQDGTRLTRRDKGPLWVIYPRDDHPEILDAAGESKFIWQLKRMEILN